MTSGGDAVMVRYRARSHQKGRAEPARVAPAGVGCRTVRDEVAPGAMPCLLFTRAGR